MLFLALVVPFIYLLNKGRLHLSLLALVLQSLAIAGIWWGWLLAAVFTVAHWVIQRKHTNSTARFKKEMTFVSPLNKADKEKAEEMASKVNTVTQLKQLEKRLEAAEEEINTADTEAQKHAAQIMYDIIDEAVDIASLKTTAWQFLPHLTLDCPMQYFDKAYEVMSIADSENLRQTMKAGCHWLELSIGDEPEKPKIEIYKLKQLKEITLQDKSDVEIAIEIDRYCEAHEDVANYWFDKNTKPSEQWLTEKSTGIRYNRRYQRS
jgi:uncharacterized membrane protein YciS (DUF1049 family)